MPMPTKLSLFKNVRENWKSGIAIAFISVPLSVAISIASGAGPLPGIVTGIVGTLVASLFCSNNYNIIGAAGALTTILFSTTLIAPFGIGSAILPLLAILSGICILLICALKADTLLYYVPSSVMYGFSGGVALLIAASQLFDATGLSHLKRTGTFLGDISLYMTHKSETSVIAISVFTLCLVGILVWKKYIRSLPAIIPATIVGILVGWLNTTVFQIDIVSLGDKFGTFSGVLFLPVAWNTLPLLFTNTEILKWTLQMSGLIALIAVLETLITARIADTVTKTQSSARKELFGLGLANIASGIAGGLPATGVFIRTGANIKAGATHRTSATIAAIATALIALLVLPFFTYIPMAVIAAMLVNTALGLLDTKKYIEFWKREKSSFAVCIIVAALTVLHDAGLAVGVGTLLALILFTHTLSRGRFDVIYNYTDGDIETQHGSKQLHLPHNRSIAVLTYSIAGLLGYIECNQHAVNFRHIAHSSHIHHVIIRLRDLFSIDYEGTEMLVEAIRDMQAHGKQVYISSASDTITAELKQCIDPSLFFDKTEHALRHCGVTPQIERRFFETHIRKTI